MSTCWQRVMGAIVTTVLCTALVGGGAMAAKRPKPPPSNGPRVISYVSRANWWSGSTPHQLRTIDDIGGGGVTVVGALGIDRPQWSPDGSRLAYAKQFGDRWYDEAIMTIRPDGTDEQMVVTLQQVDAVNVADGNKVSYLHYGSRTNQPLEYFDDLAWSPTGQFIAFSARYYTSSTDADGNVHYSLRRRLYTVDVATGEIARLTPDSGGVVGDGYPHWSTTLDKIVFVSDRSTRVYTYTTLWVVNPDGTGLQEFADLGRGYVLFPTWNHLGDQIAVSFRDDLWILDIGLTDEGEPYVTDSRVVCGDPVDEETAPSWSPDDTQLVFARTVHTKRGTTDQIVKLDLATLTETVLASDKRKWLDSPDWSPVVPTQ